MHPAARELLGGQAKVRSILEKQRRVKDGRLEKKSPASKVAESQVPPTDSVVKKKPVNGYLIFRSTMQHVFTDYPQSDRSPFIREMWEKEFHKPTWTLIAKVWTHIRDHSGGFKSILQFAVAAIEETGLTQPDLWLNAYNMVLVRDNNGSLTLRQYHPPTLIPEPRQLTDVELLFHVLKRGLPVKDPVDLLDKLVKSQRHYMTVADRNVPYGEVDIAFNNAINEAPFDAFSYFTGLAPTHSCFERGVAVTDSSVLGSLRIDDALLSVTGDHTFGGFDFDISTAHLTIPNNGALNANTMTDASMVLEMGLPPQWDGLSGQITQHDYQIATDTIPNDTDAYPVNEDFFELFPGWDLQ
ncbi:mating type protein [Diaporthe sp. PMI_573]|nr:mating type protein [Diaporthaceae sp. PMI_573]